jgi:hypothetical protein
MYIYLHIYVLHMPQYDKIWIEPFLTHRNKEIQTRQKFVSKTPTHYN